MATLISAAASAALALLESAPVGLVNGPVVQIIAPPPDFKLREGRRTPVQVRVRAGSRSLRSWIIRLVEPSGSNRELATGTEATEDNVVGELVADALQRGERYTLELEAADVGGVTAISRTSIVVLNQQYTQIPLEPGNASRRHFEGLSLDGSGEVVVSGGENLGDITIIRPRDPSVQPLHVPVAGTLGQKLSKDGVRFFFVGEFRIPEIIIGLGFYDLDRSVLSVVAQTSSGYFTTDRFGRRLAFQSEYDLDPTVGNANRASQYFLYDETSGTIRQLTTDPSAIVFGPPPEFCPQYSASIPMITADGRTVVLITSATLGVVGPDPAVGCHVFAYDVATRTLRHVTALARELVVTRPTLSDDGRWLSFTLKDPLPSGLFRLRPAILDMDSGELVEAVGGYSGYPSVDSVVSGDGSAVVISSQADLDPTVGNADHNAELFMYDRAAQRFVQVTETVGGIGVRSGTCDAYVPPVNDDATTIAYSTMLFSEEACELDGPQRSEADGFVFGRVRAVRKRVDNRGPVFEQPSDARVKAGETLTHTLTATDPDNDPIVFFAQELGGMDVPLGSAIEDHHDGTATFRWPTKPESAGLYHLRVAAFDEGGGEVFHDLTIAVCSRIVPGSGVLDVLRGLFDPEPPAQCRDADLNHDGRVSAADLLLAIAAI